MRLCTYLHDDSVAHCMIVNLDAILDGIFPPLFMVEKRGFELEATLLEVLI